MGRPPKGLQAVFGDNWQSPSCCRLSASSGHPVGVKHWFSRVKALMGTSWIKLFLHPSEAWYWKECHLKPYMVGFVPEIDVSGHVLRCLRFLVLSYPFTAVLKRKKFPHVTSPLTPRSSKNQHLSEHRFLEWLQNETSEALGTCFNIQSENATHAICKAFLLNVTWFLVVFGKFILYIIILRFYFLKTYAAVLVMHCFIASYPPG